METIALYINRLIESPHVLVLPSLVFLAAFAFTFAVRGFLYRLLGRLGEKSGNPLYRRVITVSLSASILWCVVAGLHASVTAATASPQTTSYVQSLLGASIAVSMSLVLGNVAVQVPVRTLDIPPRPSRRSGRSRSGLRPEPRTGGWGRRAFDAELGEAVFKSLQARHGNQLKHQRVEPSPQDHH